MINPSKLPICVVLIQTSIFVHFIFFCQKLGYEKGDKSVTQFMQKAKALFDE